MTFGDLLDVLARTAGDESGAYRTNARKWLNGVRSMIASEADWRTTLNVDVELTTAAATTSGLYSLTGYERVSGDTMYDETNQTVIRSEALSVLQDADPQKAVTGQPTMWADAGADSSGNKRIYLWPIPDGTYTIRYSAYTLLMDIADSQDALTVDPYFGPLAPWSHCFLEGLRYYHDQDNNEDAAQIQMQLGRFMQAIRRRIQRNTVAPHARIPLQATRGNRSVSYGRFPPSHYDNR